MRAVSLGLQRLARHNPCSSRSLARASRQHRLIPDRTAQQLSLHSTVCRGMFSGPGSEKLVNQSCGGACSRDTPLVPEDQLPELLAAVPSWTHDRERKLLVKKFTAKNFMAAIRYFNKVAEVAEGEGHHPDLHLTNYRDVEVHVATHAAGGLTMFDFVLAAKIDNVDAEYSPKWLASQQVQAPKAVAT